MVTETEKKEKLPVVDIPKGPSEVLRVEACDWRGTELVQLRIWYFDGDVLKPGRKGLAVKRTLTPKIIAALQEIDRFDGGEEEE